jgi:hypothetical protein
LLGLYREEELQEPRLAAVQEEEDAENGPEDAEAVPVDDATRQPSQGVPDGDADDPSETDLKNEVLSFPTNCPDCNAPASTHMKLTSKCIVKLFSLVSNLSYGMNP